MPQAGWHRCLPCSRQSEREALQRQGNGVTRDRMLRELSEALDLLTQERPLLLVFEDLHWSDVSTLEWVAYVARRRDPARLMLLGTYRPIDAIVRAHPLPTVITELLPARPLCRACAGLSV